MSERLYLDRPGVYILAHCDARHGGRALYVVCEDPADAEYAAQLAAGLRVPLYHGSDPAVPEAARRQPSPATA